MNCAKLSINFLHSSPLRQQSNLPLRIQSTSENFFYRMCSIQRFFQHLPAPARKTKEAKFFKTFMCVCLTPNANEIASFCFSIILTRNCLQHQQQNFGNLTYLKCLVYHCITFFSGTAKLIRGVGEHIEIRAHTSLISLFLSSPVLLNVLAFIGKKTYYLFGQIMLYEVLAISGA